MRVRRRVPVLPTLIVAFAVATMLALGLWQLLDRRPAKLAYLAQLERNPALPPVAFPRADDGRLLFRRSRLDCRPPVAIRRAGAGAAGYRLIATCADGALVQLGTTRDFRTDVAWGGGGVAGYVGRAPEGQSLIGALLRPARPRPMLVADPAAAGLGPNAAPDPDTVPNNHLAYAGQWFFFAATAAIVYALALRRRNA